MSALYHQLQRIFGLLTPFQGKIEHLWTRNLIWDSDLVENGQGRFHSQFKANNKVTSLNVANVFEQILKWSSPFILNFIFCKKTAVCFRTWIIQFSRWEALNQGCDPKSIGIWQKKGAPCVKQVSQNMRKGWGKVSFIQTFLDIWPLEKLTEFILHKKIFTMSLFNQDNCQTLECLNCNSLLHESKQICLPNVALNWFHALSAENSFLLSVMDGQSHTENMAKRRYFSPLGKNSVYL